MTRDHQRRPKSPENSDYNHGYDDPMRDQRSPEPRPRHWQGQAAGEQGQWRDEPDFDRRGYGRGQQFGRAGEYGRAYEESGRQRFEGQYDRGDNDFGRGNESVRDERSGGSRSGGYGGDHHSAQGGQQQGWRAERQQQGGWGGHERPSRPRIMPKGYTRSDERLMEDICEQLSHSGVDVSEVSVDVAEGRVKLEGTVKDRRSKHAIEDIADDCPGVKDVDNRIRVQRDADTGAGEMSIGE